VDLEDDPLQLSEVDELDQVWWGPPAKELCNAFDDDCDGENDNGACPAGMICWGDQCVSIGGDGAGGTRGTGGSTSGGGGAVSGAGGAFGGASGSRGGQPPASGCAVASGSERPPDRRSARESWTATALAVCLTVFALRRTKRR